MTVALAGLGLTALLGACIAAGKIWPGHAGSLFPTLHAHVQLALLGWVLPMVLGVAAHVYPMFLLAPPPGPASVRVQYAGVALGTPAVVCGLLLDVSPLVVGGALLVAGAVGAHVAWIVAATRSSRRPRLDWGLRLVLAGAGVLALAAAVGLLLAAGVAGGPRTALAYGVLALGWASLTIVGMMLKIVTFLVWYRAYAGRAGREPVPTLAQMSSERGEAAACALLTCGVAALAGAVWLGEPALIRAAGTTVAAGTLAFAYALARVLWHLTIVRPQARMPATTVAAR
jgi:hypothetical protein